jgi:uridylate kinase
MSKSNRALLKISGEQLAGQYEHGIDPEFAGWLAEEIKSFAENDSQVIIMVGGGNFVRGAQVAGHGIKRVTADHMGMMATMMNAIALTDVFEKHDVRTRCLSNVFAPQVSENFSHRLAEKHLAKKRVVIVAGGVGRPYFTTDTAAVNLALELDCRAVYKATKVDGIYSKDPTKFDDATRYDHVKFKDAVENDHIRVMDKAALALAMEHDLQIVVFDALAKDNIRRVARGESVGTLVS